LSAELVWMVLAALGVALSALLLALWRRSVRQLRAVQQANEATQRQQHELIDALDIGLVVYDADDRLSMWNRDFAALYAPLADVLHVGCRFEDLLRRTVERHLVPEARGREEDWVRERLRAHARAEGTALRELSNGRWRRITERRLPDGRMLSYSIDVTELVLKERERDAARQAAEQAVTRLEEAIEALPVGFEWYDADDRLVMSNAVLRDLVPDSVRPLMATQPTFEALVRANAAAGGLAPGVDVEALLETRRAERRHPGRPTVQHLANGRILRTHERRTRDGGLVGVRIDVTELEAQRAAAQEASSRLQDAIEALPDGFALFDANDCLAACNSRYRAIYSESAPALRIGTRFESILRYGLERGQYPQAVGREEAWLAERLYRHRHPGPPELQELPGNRWLRIDERITRDGGIAGVRADVTELVRREQQLQQVNAELDAANTRLAALSDTDGLTGIPNRRQFDRRLLEEWTRAQRHGLPLALLMIDVDHFKRYNDLHGHLDGDACLRRIAALLRDTARRPSDLVARYGGEEFVMLLPHTGAEGALVQAGRCLAAADAAAMPHGDSPVARHVTLSIGVMAMQPDEMTADPQALVRAADAALYRAKQAGRHQVVAGAPPVSATV
jgi:diguanylate cyclase (GGDEF)-like protein